MFGSALNTLQGNSQALSTWEAGAHFRLKNGLEVAREDPDLCLCGSKFLSARPPYLAAYLQCLCFQTVSNQFGISSRMNQNKNKPQNTLNQALMIMISNEGNFENLLPVTVFPTWSRSALLCVGLASFVLYKGKSSMKPLGTHGAISADTDNLLIRNCKWSHQI